MPPRESPTAQPQPRLTLVDCVSIIVGIIIGAGIFETTPQIARSVGGPGWLILAWLLGGLVSLMGALCYAELATACPREGGEYVFLSRALGRRTGLLFAWASFWIVRPGNIGAMAFIFARYAIQLWPLGLGDLDRLVYAVAAVVPLTLMNVMGVEPGKWTQNVLTACKMLGLLAVVAAGLLAEGPAPTAAAAGEVAAATDADFNQFHLAMILVLFTFGGWNEMAYVAAEVRRPQQNILRALVLGTVAVTGLYLLINIAALHALGFAGLRQSSSFVADVVGGRAVSVLVCVSCLGAINGMILTGARIFYAVGTEHRNFRWLGRWSGRLGTPVRSLTLQAIVTLGLMAAFGLYEDGFERMVILTGPIFWLFLLLTGVALFVLRRREPASTRPYQVPFYPWTPLLFCLAAGYMFYASVSYAWQQQYAEGWWSLAALAAGAVCVWNERRN